MALIVFFTTQLLRPLVFSYFSSLEISSKTTSVCSSSLSAVCVGTCWWWRKRMAPLDSHERRKSRFALSFSLYGVTRGKGESQLDLEGGFHLCCYHHHQLDSCTCPHRCAGLSARARARKRLWVGRVDSRRIALRSNDLCQGYVGNKNEKKKKKRKKKK